MLSGWQSAQSAVRIDSDWYSKEFTILSIDKA